MLRFNRSSRLAIDNRNTAANFGKEVRRMAYIVSRGKCNNPICGKKVVETGKYHTGEAAHIYAASPGGPRYDKDMTNEERRNINNCLLLCRSCHRLIDDPETSGYFDAELLKSWRPLHRLIEFSDESRDDTYIE